MSAIRELNLEKKKNDINDTQQFVFNQERETIKRTKIINGKPFIIYSHFSTTPLATPFEKLLKVIDLSF